MSFITDKAKDRITWFSDSPDKGTRECICSWCGHVIFEEPFRNWDQYNRELRLHEKCFGEIIRFT